MTTKHISNIFRPQKFPDYLLMASVLKMAQSRPGWKRSGRNGETEGWFILEFVMRQQFGDYVVTEIVLVALKMGGIIYHNFSLCHPTALSV